MNQPPRDPRIPDLISLREAATILGVSRQFTHRLALTGELRGARIGEAWVFRRATVEKRAQNGGQKPSATDGGG